MLLTGSGNVSKMVVTRSAKSGLLTTMRSAFSLRLASLGINSAHDGVLLGPEGSLLSVAASVLIGPDGNHDAEELELTGPSG